MTEKRFTFYRNEEFNTSIIYDKEDEVYYFCVDLEKIADMLNAQHETIQDQKRQLDELDGLLNEFEVTFEELEDILYMNRGRL